jgi:hypothetical protein
MAKSTPAPTVAEMLGEASRIGRELRHLSTWQANRLTQPAMLAQAVAVSGCANLDELRTLAEKVTTDGQPYLDRQLAHVVESWRDPVGVWVPGHHGIFAQAVTPEQAAAYSERLSLAITPRQASGIAILALASEPGARFGECEAPGAVEARVLQLHRELEALNVELHRVIRLEDLRNVQAEVEVSGRVLPYSPRLAYDVAAVAT